MVVVPEFLIKRIYKKGSLTKLDDGASWCLKMYSARDISADLVM